MRKSITKKLVTATMVAACAVVLSASVSPAQQAPAAPAKYPDRPVTFVVPMGAGTGFDMHVRYLAKKLEIRLGQPFVVENRPGMAGGVGSASVARATPDGYTILGSFLSANVFNPIIHKQLPYDVKDLQFVTLLYDAPFVLVVSAERGPKTYKQLVDMLKKAPSKFSYASGGMGSAAHIAAAMFVRLIGADGVVHVPYKTTSLIWPDLIGNQVAFGLYSPDSVVSNVKSGKLRALFVAAPNRLATLPDVPTAAEVGLPDMRASSWYVLQAPARTPKAIVDMLAKEVSDILKEPESAAWFARTDSVPLPGYTPESTARFVEDEKTRWEPHVRASGASVK